jgi:hypothetical protein
MYPPLLADWVIPTLKDISAFLAENGMHDSANAVAEAASKVQVNARAKTSINEDTLSTTARFDGGIIRFCIHPRNRQ